MIPIFYVYFLDLVHMDAASIQALSMVNAWGKHHKIKVIIPWVSRLRLRRLNKSWALPDSVRFLRIPMFSIRASSKFQDIGRISYTLLSFFILLPVRHKRVFTRDISLPLLCSFIPQSLKPRFDLTLELHKIYFRATKKVRYEREAAAYRNVRRFVCTTRAASRDLRRYFDVSSERILTLPNGVDVDFVRQFRPVLKESAAVERNNYPLKVVYSGSFAAWKGVDLLVSACRFLTTGSYKLILVGAMPHDEKRIRELSQEMGISPYVVILPRLPRPRALTVVAECECAIVPNPPSLEGTDYTCPIKVFEYLALGLPIVASRLPSLEEILVEYENAEFFRPDDPYDLAAKIRLVISDSGKRRQMAKDNLQLACAHTWEQRAAKLKAFIENEYTRA